MLFTTVRGNGEDSIGVTGMVKPLLITALPTAAFVAYKRAAPPQALLTSLYACVLLHAYDRIWHPKGITIENMPTAHMNRRVF